MTKRLLPLCLSSALMLLLACGGDSTPATAPSPAASATAIAYTNPTAVPATSYHLSKNATLSTPGSHLVLDLFGPATTATGCGVVLTLNLDTTKATWSSTTPVANGSVFINNANGEPIVKGMITGNTLQVVVTQRGMTSPKPFDAALLQIALDLKTGQTVGSAITLTSDLSKSQVLLGTDTVNPSPFPDLRIGTLTAQ